LHVELGSLPLSNTLAQPRSALALYASVILLAGALFYLRVLAPSLGDGAVAASGESPYIYSPDEIYEASHPGASSRPALAKLAVMSNEADGLTGEINSSALTTIYPPAAQAVFVVAHWIAPFKSWGLQLVFLLIEFLGLWVLLAGLKARALPRLWSAIYWLNPIIILTSYNGVHMPRLKSGRSCSRLFYFASGAVSPRYIYPLRFSSPF